MLLMQFVYEKVTQFVALYYHIRRYVVSAVSVSKDVLTAVLLPLLLL